MPQFSIKQLLGVLLLSSVGLAAYSEYAKRAGYRYMKPANELAVEFLSDERRSYVELKATKPNLYLLPEFDKEIEVRIHTAAYHTDWHGHDLRGGGMDIHLLIVKDDDKLKTGSSFLTNYLTMEVVYPETRVPHKFLLSWKAICHRESIDFTLLMKMNRAGRTVEQQEFRLTTAIPDPPLNSAG